jgi:hypothetical protein
MRSHTRQSIYCCVEDVDGALVDFWVPSSGNSVSLQNQTSGNLFHLSPDPSACDYFLWGCLKSKIFISKPRTIEELNQRIKEEIAAVPGQMAHEVMENLQGRLEQFEEWWEISE